jgi:transcription elongation factor GreA
MNSQKEYLSKEKFEQLSHELEQLKTVKRKEIADSLEFAKQLGDLSENAEYHEAREEQAATEDRILKLETILKSAEIMSLHHTTEVDIGSTVTVRKDGEKEKMTYKIVGSEESNMAEKKISFRSPLGQSMMGKKKNDSFTFAAPKGKVTYTILAIE